jgi:hypothetical protein
VKHLCRRRVFAQESGDLLHLRNPAIRLLVHARNLAGEPRQQCRLARRELSVERLGDPGAGRGEHHRGAERGQPLGDAGIRHLQGGSRADAARHDSDIEAVGAKCQHP